MPTFGSCDPWMGLLSKCSQAPRVLRRLHGRAAGSTRFGRGSRLHPSELAPAGKHPSGSRGFAGDPRMCQRRVVARSKKFCSRQKRTKQNKTDAVWTA